MTLSNEGEKKVSAPRIFINFIIYTTILGRNGFILVTTS